MPSDATAQATIDAIASFTHSVIDAVCEHVPCVKFQSACFERYGWQGVRALEQVIGHADECGLEVILDAKRGDIGISAVHYAAAAFEGHHHADWLTINAYLGADGITPFLRDGCGAFALVRTSNPGGDELQGSKLADGSSIAEAVAQMIASIGAGTVGSRGYSSLGAVVGATKPADAQRLRELMPQQIFLVPGYGAQGGGVQDVLPCFRGESGAIVTASRSVIFAFSESEDHWQKSIRDAAARFADEIGSALGMR